MKTRKYFSMLLVILMLATTLSGLWTIPVSAAESLPSDKLVRIRYPYTGNYLMVDSDTDGARLKQRPLVESDESYVFRLHHSEQGVKIYTLNGKVVEIRNSSMSDWAEAAIWSNHNGANAYWTLTQDGDKVFFKNRNSGKMLNVGGRDGENLIQYHADGTPAEVFELENYTNDVLVRIRYRHSGRYLDIPIDKIHENGTQLQLWDYTGRDNQLFRLHPVGHRYFQIFSVLDNKLVEVRNSSHEACEDVSLWDRHNLACGKWSLEPDTDNTYLLKNRESQLFMNVASGQGGNGNPIWQYVDDNTDALNFEIIPVDSQAYSRNIIDLARAQLGNDGRRYWKHFGLAEDTPWCAAWVSWLADQCGYLDNTIPKFFSCRLGAGWFQKHGQWLDGSAEPKPGYIIFYTDGDSPYSHTGLVVGFTNGTISTIEGNWSNRVSAKTFSLDDPRYRIAGYGTPAYWKASLLR